MILWGSLISRDVLDLGAARLAEKTISAGNCRRNQD
jgi:hypothetical protein